MNFTLYYADSLGNPGNCSYPHRITVTDEESLHKATAHDYVCAEYRNHYRNGENFLGADCLPVDCDNDHSDNPEDWVTPDNIRDAFPAVSFAVHYSRSHMKEKHGKAARPKFHVLFPIDPVTDVAVYSSMKKKVNELFPYFDTKALDAARFFFGTSLPEIEMYEGSITLTQYLDELALPVKSFRKAAAMRHYPGLRDRLSRNTGTVNAPTCVFWKRRTNAFLPFPKMS